MQLLFFSRRVFVALFLLHLLFTGCDRKNPSSQQESPATAVQAKPSPTVLEQSKLPATPQKACGDSLPKDANAYPINLYPVFVDYSEKNLELVKQHFCEDALKKFIQKTGKDSIQVASFTSQEKSSQFKKYLTQYFSDVDLGVPTIKKDPPASISNGSSKSIVKVLQQPLFSSNITTQNTQLSLSQINQLNSLKFKTPQGTEVKSKIILFTYIPPGFKLDTFEVDNSWKGFYQEAGYSITYRSKSNNYCFGIHAYRIPGAGGASAFEMIKNIQSPIGKINIGYTSFDQSDQRALISSKFSISSTNNTYGYIFQSPSQKTTRESSSFRDCNVINLQDAVKIVQSFQYLSSKEPHNIKIENQVVHTSDPSAP